MNFHKLTELKQHYEEAIKEAQFQLSTTDPEIYGEYWRTRMKEAQHHLWIVNKQIEQMRQIIFIKIVLELTWNLDTFDHPIPSENYV